MLLNISDADNLKFCAMLAPELFGVLADEIDERQTAMLDAGEGSPAYLCAALSALLAARMLETAAVCAGVARGDIRAASIGDVASITGERIAYHRAPDPEYRGVTLDVETDAEAHYIELLHAMDARLKSAGLSPAFDDGTASTIDFFDHADEPITALDEARDEHEASEALRECGNIHVFAACASPDVRDQCAALADYLFTLHLSMMAITSENVTPRRTSASALSIAWGELLDRLQRGKTRVCAACGRVMIAGNERGVKRKYCSDRCRVWANNHPGERRQRGKMPGTRS